MSASASSVGGKETLLQMEEAWSPQIGTNTHMKHHCKGSHRISTCRDHGGLFSEQNSWIPGDDSATTDVVSFRGTSPQFGERSCFQSPISPFSKIKCHQNLGRWAFALLEPSGFCITNVCVYASAEIESMDFLLGLIQLIWMHTAICIVACFCMRLKMQNRNKKIWSDNFYAFQNKVEISSPNIDINKIAQAGKDFRV